MKIKTTINLCGAWAKEGKRGCGGKC